MRFLKTNTATRITVGPFLDKTDGITPEVALTATNEQATFVVDTGGVPTLVLDTTLTASGGNNDFVHITNDDAGFYDMELTAANTNYLGRAILSINYVTDHCPVFHEFMILPANVYDSMVLGTDTLNADVTQWNGTNVGTPDTAGFPKVTIKSGTGTGEVSLTSGVAAASVKQIDDNAASAANLKQSTLAIVTGVIGSSSSTTNIITSSMSPTCTATDQFKGQILSFAEDTTTTNLRGQKTNITSNTSGGVLTVTALTDAPVSGDTFSIT